MMPPSPSRIRAEKAGQRGEWLAALWLRAQGFRIRALRFKTPVGEIDLVAERFGQLVFVEVKTRSKTTDLESALYAVNRSRIIRAAEYYLSRHPALADRGMQFDVIFLARGRLPRHFRNAFQVE